MGKQAPKCGRPVIKANALGFEQDAVCLKPAVQRIVTPDRIMHRCDKHRTPADEIASNGWSTWEVEA